MVLVIDNYDSFTFNLVQYIGELGKDVEVRRNNQITIEEFEALKPDHIVISPGPGIPEAAGVSIPIVRELGGEIPILRVCVRRQPSGVAFGGSVIREPYLMHRHAAGSCHRPRQ